MGALEDPLKTPNPSNSTKATQSLAVVGEALKQARCAQNISINELAESLRIGEEQLVALEQGKAELLPEMVFIKAMIIRLAEKLHLNSSPLLAQLKNTNQDVSRSTKISKGSSLNTKHYLAYIIIIILSLSGITVARLKVTSDYKNNDTNTESTRDRSSRDPNGFNSREESLQEEQYIPRAKD